MNTIIRNRIITMSITALTLFTTHYTRAMRSFARYYADNLELYEESQELTPEQKKMGILWIVKPALLRISFGRSKQPCSVLDAPPSPRSASTPNPQKK